MDTSCSFFVDVRMVFWLQTSDVEECFEESDEDAIRECSVMEGVVEQDEWLRAVAEDSVLQRVCKTLKYGWNSNESLMKFKEDIGE
ncbi:hypothetical protein NDU88_010381 [Pleurodeles waltl]|uniref:Uncharacterized protein n=1 Tax=Pleurodeles waltl TaxID=8319 RepID=A0AAV7QYK6_PLEWA|nr:hypothetical protein NDU88_010381 [Pleurodeles waltl]